MNQKLTRILLETTIRNTIKDIRQDPERRIRNLVDLALYFSHGRFQKQFLETAREMLEKEDSAYYILVQDLVSSVHMERLVTFGMNVGYNGCITGARTIRQIEEKEGFNIPWCLSLMLEETTLAANRELYLKLIRQGEKLGIHTWLLHIPRLTPELLKLTSLFPDSAFLLFCLPDTITPKLLAAGRSLNNLMFVCLYQKNTQEACQHICRSMRQQGYLYGLCLPYGSQDRGKIRDRDFLREVLRLKPAFTFFTPNERLEESAWESFYSEIKKLRLGQEYPTVFLELMQDNRWIDSIISSEGLSGGFLPSGQFFSLKGPEKNEKANLFSHELKDILKLAFPKGKG